MGKKILIADDEENIVFLLKKRLESYGHEVICATNGRQALDKALREKPDLMIVDVLMPEMTGYEMVRQIRAKGGDIKNVPVIIITAKPTMRDFFEAIENVVFIQKPFDQAKLMDVIDGHLQKLGTLPAPPVVAASPASGASKASPVNVSPVNAPPPEESSRPAVKINRKVMLAGVDDFSMDRLKMAMENLGCQVFMMLDEKETMQQLERIKPDVAFIQYWEDSARFDSGKIHHYYMGRPELHSIRFVLFCERSIEIDACKTVKAKDVIGYGSSSDLVKKVESFLTSLK